MKTLAAAKKLGEFTRLTKCRLCGSQDLATFLDFGDFPLAGAFLKPEEVANEKFYPMGVQFCRSCTMVQVDTAVSADTLFKNYFYFSSAIGTLREHFAEFSDEIGKEFAVPGESLVVEIGSNDGVLLRPLRARGIRCVGVDPATNVVNSIKEQGIRVINDCFTSSVARGIRRECGAADAVVSSFSFAHIDDIHEVARGIDLLLSKDGVFIFEIYYLGIVIEELQYDMIYHEHMSYYTYRSLEKFLGAYGLEIFDIKRIPLRSGTLRFYARRVGSGKRPKTSAVERHRDYERSSGLWDEATYLGFGERVNKTRADLMRLLGRLKSEGKSVIGYGASGRATTIMNYCGIDTRHLDYVVDDAPAKHGFLTPGTHIPIKPWPMGEGAPPDYALVFAWPFIEEIEKRRKEYLARGGRFIVPLPEVRVSGPSVRK